jgi:hypothetical protein
VTVTRYATLGLLLLAPFAACGKKIGDACKATFDCNQADTTRSCDISEPGGYCTVEGCDQSSCPEEAVCVSFYPRLFLDPSDPSTKHCSATMPCAPDEICLDEGVCASRLSEVRQCMLSCDDGGDCRDGYECRVSGALGSKAITTNPNAKPKFCASRAR